MEKLVCAVLAIAVLHRASATKTEQNDGRARYITGTNNNHVEYEVTAPERVSKSGNPHPHHKHFIQYGHSGKRTGTLYYKLAAFGRDFQFQLEQDNSFVSPSLTVEHVFSDERRLPFAGDLLHCFYSGQVQGDPLSSAVFNLCNGMRGSFLTKGQRYFVEPAAEDKVNTTRDFRKYHIVYRHATLERGSRINGTSTCGLKETNNPMLQARGRQPRPVNETARSRRKRRGINEAFVETMVVADKTMVEAFPSKADLQSYIITLMGVVAQVYRERSIGNPINIVVVKIVLLESDEPSLHISTNAARTLRSFCRWQKKVMTKEKTHPEHHDTAILITRRDICRQPGKCDTLGLAELGTMCLESKSCALAEDSGLSTAYTISHELGHVFNLPHDGDNNECSRGSGRQHLMAPSLSFDTKPWSWSSCSRDKLTDFLDLGYGACLADKPHEKAKIKFFDTLPGELYSANKQCQMIFGDKSSLCSFMEPCRRLWCVKKIGNRKGCSTHHMPWADGTPCSKNRWCIRGQCVKKRKLKPVDGNWGQWAPYDECTRTCGGGISFSHRQCNNPTPENGGRFCVGSRKRFKSCNTQSCPKNSLDFRYEQCARKDGRSLKSYKSTRWLPKYAGIRRENQCKLYCRMAGTAIYFKLNDKVIDGTPCNQETSDICVDGKCLPAGCDRVLYSEAKYDRCGVCKGDSSSCRRFSGTFNETSFGYNYIFTIPVGATDIVITQNGWKNTEDESFLALQSEGGSYLLNGAMTIQLGVREFRAAGANIWYSGSKEPFEQIKIDGKTNEPIKVLVLEVGEKVFPPNVHYSLYEVVVGPQKFKWDKLGPWTQCSELCQGVKKRRPRCVRAVDGLIVSSSRCEAATRPSSVTEECNIGCRLRWHTQTPGKCSARCGPGYETRIVRCMRISSGQWDIVLDKHCAAVRKPPVHVPCEGTCEGTRWKYSQWSKCSKSCSGGTQARQAKCQDTFGENLKERDCRASDKQVLTRQCSSYRCPWWTAGKWGSCSVTCGSGWQQRAVKCEGEWGQVRDRACDPGTKPLTRKPCDLEKCPFWREGQWTDCSVTCGAGSMTRPVQCISGTEVNKQVSDDRCSVDTKPEPRKDCKTQKCTSNLYVVPGTKAVDYHWRLSLWTPCSVTCGEKSGRQQRDVECVHVTPGKQVMVDENHCEHTPKPVDSKVCSVLPCTSWKHGSWGRCSHPCGRGFQFRVVKCTYDDWKITEDKNCDLSQRPLKRKICQIKPCVPTTTTPATEETTSIIRVKPITTPTTKPPRELPTWTVDRWSECSVSCGQGFREREVQCRLNSGEISNECDEAARPPSTMACTRRACPNWRKGPWSACSMSCGEGIRRRDVICKFDNGESSSGCDEKKKPAFREACHVRPCPSWITEDWNRCSVTCGQGVKQRLVQCGDKDVSCDASTKPQATASCNLASCPKWTTGEWGECSVSCGNGMKTRAVECDGKNAICDSRTKPEATARCNLRSCPQWKTGEWRECSVSCGNGFKRRTVECDGENARCDSRTKPEATARCNLRSCPQWKTGEWKECSVTCGDGFKRRSVTCEALNARCDARTKPGTIARCKLGSCPEWKTGKWSQCSTTCGNGVRERTVECSDASAKCNPRNKPQTTWRCNMRSCAEWTAGKWSQCSVTCGNGYKRRSATCDTKHGRCDRRSRPVTIARCNDGACPKWTIGRWSKCSVTCGNGFITRAVECSRSDAKCVARIKPTPTLRCNAGSCPEWRSGRWSKCSVTCGSGSKARTVQCSQTRRACDVTKKPEATASCNPASCPKWETGEWSECSVTCGNGSKQRTVECSGKSGCDPESKPETTARCAPGSCPKWTAGQWTKCSVSCGNGSRERIVQCDGSSGSCDPKTKPTEKDRCSVGLCPHWKIGEWAECSVSCGNGFKERKIECITGVNATCDVRTKPVVTAKCNQGLCPRWNTGRWTQCSQTCGEGVKRRAVGCFALNSHTMLHESACDLKQKPSSNEICNTMDCVSGAKWYKGEWGKCSVYCGIGDKLRDIYCSAPNGTKVPDVYCAGDHKPKPKRSCNKRRRCGEWEFGLWSKCSLTCGKGFKTRPIRCLHQLEYKGEMYCDSKTRPLERTKCNIKACPALPDIYHWQSSGWSKCSSTCGYGKKSRDVWCVDLSRRNISSKFCKPATKPEELSSCFEVKCPAKWKHGHWTECSKSCGRGYQYRAVECVAKLGRSQATKCDRWTKPPVWRPCNMGNCDGFVFWRVGPWSPECSVSCGVGVMRRAVRCFARNGTIVEDSRCENPMLTKPDTSRPCHMKACQPKNCKDVQTLNGVQTDGEQTLTIKGKELKVFCYAMMSKEPKEYITLKTSSDNFAEIYPKILRNSRTCPANGSHLEKCDCEEEDYKLSGGSYFSKLRIDLVAMKIIGEDQRFASTTGLNPPSYATAGDCYSAHGKCPQGRFSINLQDTGLRLTRKVMWKSTGRGYSQIIYRYPEGLQVIGKCGGKCGTCRPEANIGLQVELSQGDS